jgi:hypothetical protein
MAKVNSRLSTDNVLKRPSFFSAPGKNMPRRSPLIDPRLADYDSNRQNSPPVPGSTAGAKRPIVSAARWRLNAHGVTPVRSGPVAHQMMSHWHRRPRLRRHQRARSSQQPRPQLNSTMSATRAVVKLLVVYRAINDHLSLSGGASA